jgi:CheY-like chemotaxis protein
MEQLVHRDLCMTRRPHLLIVDDDPDLRTLFASVFRRAAYSVEVASDGRDALERIEKRAPDLVVTDLDMPIVDGVTLVRRLRHTDSGRHIPVVVVSGRPDSVPELAEVPGPAVALLRKPVDFRTLTETVGTLLDLHHAAVA